MVLERQSRLDCSWSALTREWRTGKGWIYARRFCALSPLIICRGHFVFVFFNVQASLWFPGRFFWSIIVIALLNWNNLCRVLCWNRSILWATIYKSYIRLNNWKGRKKGKRKWNHTEKRKQIVLNCAITGYRWDPPLRQREREPKTN